MKTAEVPQDDTPTFRGYGTKALYAVDAEGRYAVVPSSGWEAEEVVLRDVIDDFRRKAAAARQRFLEGVESPVGYFMNRNLMDLPAVSRGIGLARWRVRRHMRPAVFRRLRPAVLARYAEFFRTSVENFTTLREEEGIEP